MHVLAWFLLIDVLSLLKKNKPNYDMDYKITPGKVFYIYLVSIM